jgi:hypothetical protein
MTKPVAHHATHSEAARASQTELIRSAKAASRGTSTDFRSLLASSLSESHHNPLARNKRSSAAGAYQFTERTWLDLLRRHGAELGAGDAAAKITVNKHGTPTVADSSDRAAILALRSDSNLAGALAARYFDENRVALDKSLGRKPSENEVRMAYLLGASGASHLLKAAQDRPEIGADKVVPGAVHANPSLFRNADGTVKTAGEAVASLDRHFTTAMQHANGATRPQLSFLLANEVAGEIA